MVTRHNPLETFPPGYYPLQKIPVGRLGSWSRIVGRIGPGVRVSASFQIFVLKIAIFWGKCLWGVISGGDISRGQLGVISHSPWSANLNRGDFNHDLNQVSFFVKKITWFKSQLPVYFEFPLCKNISHRQSSTTHVLFETVYIHLFTHWVFSSDSTLLLLTQLNFIKDNCSPKAGLK